MSTKDARLLTTVINAGNMAYGSPLVKNLSRRSQEILSGMERLESMIERETEPKRKEELEELLRNCESALRTLLMQTADEITVELEEKNDA